MGTFFVEAHLAAVVSTYTWVAAGVLRALSVVPTERRHVVTIEGQVVERETAEVLIPALQYGAAALV